MSFMLTTRQVRDRSKTVTRRIGWWFLNPGDRLMACVKCQGLGKGGKIEKICEIEVVSARVEKLDKMDGGGQFGYGDAEAKKEGFPELTGTEFVTMFCENMKCQPDDKVNRIEFKYVEKGRQTP